MLIQYILIRSSDRIGSNTKIQSLNMFGSDIPPSPNRRTFSDNYISFLFPKIREFVNNGLNFSYVVLRGTSILGEVRNVEIPGPTQQLLCSKYHDFLAVFPLAQSKINQIA